MLQHSAKRETIEKGKGCPFPLMHCLPADDVCQFVRCSAALRVECGGVEVPVGAGLEVVGAIAGGADLVAVGIVQVEVDLRIRVRCV